jgi:O-acetylhomoserine/O-acetylserine sulfhydrylase-like pyridoxal-dependent enzyme
VTTLLIAVLVLSAFQTNKKTKFEEIDVEHINLVEKDGKLRLVITNTDRLPDALLNGKIIHRQGAKSPGMIFYNGKGDEAGGLIVDSNTQGKNYSARAARLFDQYNQDKTAGIVYEDKNGHRMAGL